MKAAVYISITGLGLSLSSPVLSAAPSKEANALAMRGTEAARNRQWDEAIDDLRKATEMEKKYAPSLIAALLGRAATNGAQQQLPQATADYDEVLKLDPRNTTALEGRASIAIKANDLDKAAALYSEAIKVNPREPRFYQYRSYIYELKGDLKPAMADTEMVLKLQKDQPDAVARKQRLQARLAQGEQNQQPPVTSPQGRPPGG
jgi:tetratricopeptide (TPR) repeat protein